MSSLLLVHPSDEPYGSDRVALQLATGMTARGWSVTVLLPDDTAPGWLSARLVEAGIEAVRGPLAVARRRYLSRRRVWSYPRRLRAARAFIAGEATRRHASVIHLNTSSLLVGAVLGRPAGARLVWHVHELIVRPRLVGWLFRLPPALCADRVIAISDAVARHLGPFRRGRIRVVHNGVDAVDGGPSDASPEDGTTGPGASAAGPVTVAFVGRLNRWKGYQTFIDAARLVARTDDRIRFVIAGAPPPGEEWRAADLGRRIAAAGLSDRVSALGPVDDAKPVIASADLLVVPSIWPEPFGLVALEAMRLGRPVIASAHGGILELVEDGTTGLLFPPGDADRLALAIRRLADDPQLRARLGAAGRRSVAERFTTARFLDGVAAVYGELTDA